MKRPQLAWITGANGLIGSHLARTAFTHPPTHSLTSPLTIRALTRRDLDLTDFPAVRRAFQQDQPQLIIHCAAISKSTACQADPALARKVNVEATAELADLAAAFPFSFFPPTSSSTAVTGNYVESDAVNPLSIYAETKVGRRANRPAKSPAHRHPHLAQRWRFLDGRPWVQRGNPPRLGAGQGAHLLHR